MNEAAALYTKASSAHDVTQKFLVMAPLVWSGLNVRLFVTTNFPGLGTDVTGPAEGLATNPKIMRFLAAVKDKSHVIALSVQMHNVNDSGSAVSYDTSDAIVGKIRPNVSNDPDRAPKLLDALEAVFNVTSYVDVVKGSYPGINADAIAVRERSVADLQEAIKKLAAFQADLSKREVDRREQLQAQMNAAHQARTDALEKEYRDRQAELDRQRQSADDQLTQREKEFLERVAHFETKEAKYMRRELLKQIRETLAEAEKMVLSKPTAKKRWFVHLAVFVLLMGSGALAGVMTTKLFKASEVDWHLLAPLSAGFLAFVGTMVYYLKWNDRWFREHADAEFAAKRYKADILRASWVAELVQEWAKEGKGDLPPELIAAYTQGLFKDVGASRVNEHPFDHLTSVMKRATEFDIGKGMISVRGYKPEAKHRAD